MRVLDWLVDYPWVVLTFQGVGFVAIGGYVTYDSYIYFHVLGPGPWISLVGVFGIIISWVMARI
jgi:hypothetical protein